MAIRVDADQSGGDGVMAVRANELQDVQPATVRELAGRWETGLQAVMGLAGVAGLVGAPLAAGRLATSTQIVVGALLGGVLALAGGGLLLTMAAAYGSTRRRSRAATATEYERRRQELAARGLDQLVWGRRLAVGSMVLLAATVVVAWVDPASPAPARVRVGTTAGAHYCAVRVAVAGGALAVDTVSDGRVSVPLAEVAVVQATDDCQE